MYVVVSGSYLFCSVKVQNGTEAMETSVEMRSHSRKISNTSNRYSYIEAVSH